MKRECPDSPKFRRLCRRLRLEPWGVVGVLESLWHFTAKQAPRGDIGRWSDEDIAEAIGWRKRSAGTLIEVLVEERWFDADTEHRLIVHDWSEHADDYIHMRLARARERFADGRAPSLSRLPKNDRESLQEFYAKRTPSAHERTESDAKRTPSAQRHTTKPSLAKPSQDRDGRSATDPLSEEFESSIKPRYPKRDGDQRWKQAFGHYRAARKAGESLDEILAAVEAYRSRCDSKGFTGSDKVKQAATFFADEECRRATTWEASPNGADGPFPDPFSLPAVGGGR